MSPIPAADLSPIATCTSGRWLTVADLAVFPTQLPSGPVEYELDRGKLVILTPHGPIHGHCQARISCEISLQRAKPDYGAAFTRVGFVASRNPDTVFAPDVAFVAKSKFPIQESPEGYLETVPDLVVEVRSKNDTVAELERKAAIYLAAGVGTVWLADPMNKAVTVLRQNLELRIYRIGETLESDEPIPGFKMRLADIFPD